MEVIKARNVNDAYAQGLQQLYLRGVEEPSRNGPVIVAPWPVTTVYARPQERVLFSPLRDANPFFHLMEALWMLAGRNDVAFPAFFAANIKNYSDDGRTLFGAYGFRWKQWFGYDQLNCIIKELRKNPASRRCVLAMWDATPRYQHAAPYGDYEAGDLEIGMTGGRDVPCNTHAYVDARGGRLNLTVCCRSNDIVWGCYGANAVHFSVLQEVLAAAVGVPVGTYYQISNNFHIYTDVFKKEQFPDMAADAAKYDGYALAGAEPFPIVADYARWMEELQTFLEFPLRDGRVYKERFFQHVVVPMYAAWSMRKQKEGTGMSEAMDIHAIDWQIVCRAWIQRREDRKKQQVEGRPTLDITQQLPDPRPEKVWVGKKEDTSAGS